MALFVLLAVLMAIAFRVAPRAPFFGSPFESGKAVLGAGRLGTDKPGSGTPGAETPRTRSLDAYQFALDFSGDPGFSGGGDHVDFAAHAEFRQIDARLDGEASIGQQKAFVVGFQIV